MPILRVSPWEFSSIRKNANDLTPGEFDEWMLAKWPHLRNHFFEQVDIVVDYENGTPPAVWETVERPVYILVLIPK